MRLAQKIIIIILVLLAPILVFLFLKQFGENEFSLPVYYEEGNPLKECNQSVNTHEVDLVTLQIEPPALISFYSATTNEFSSDMENVLSKYPMVHHRQFSRANLTMENNIQLDSATYSQYLNCELIMGEDQFLSEEIPYKFVLVDREGKIRGYFLMNDLDDIERLDIELDILLNY